MRLMAPRDGPVDFGVYVGFLFMLRAAVLMAQREDFEIVWFYFNDLYSICNCFKMFGEINEKILETSQNVKKNRSDENRIKCTKAKFLN